MNILTIPHPSLRTPAQTVTKVDKKVLNFVDDLKETLSKKRNPKGVGLAAPQVDTLLRIFATQLPNAHGKTELRVFINPQIVKHSPKQTYGPPCNDDDVTLEGCLSIPGLYGPVPRWEFISLQYEVIVDDELVTRQEMFEEFTARVVQHEYDHLDGVLFIDYSLEYDLPLYREDPITKKLLEIEPDMAAALVEKSR